LNPILHEKSRLGLVSVLATAGALTFRELKELVGMTDGNLSVHLRVLEAAGYVEVEKTFVGRKPQTRVSLSRHGRRALVRYIDHLEAIVEEVRGR
jgi:DNA-binding MarR family transcriptional regulator